MFTSAVFILHLYDLSEGRIVLIISCILVVHMFSDSSVIHDQSLCSTQVHVLYVLRLNKDECNIKPYIEHEDQRLLNPMATQPQRSWLVLFSCTTQFCPDSGSKAKTIRFAFLSANTAKY